MDLVIIIRCAQFGGIRSRRPGRVRGGVSRVKPHPLAHLPKVLGHRVYESFDYKEDALATMIRVSAHLMSLIRQRTFPRLANNHEIKARCWRRSLQSIEVLLLAAENLSEGHKQGRCDSSCDLSNLSSRILAGVLGMRVIIRGCDIGQ